MLDLSRLSAFAIFVSYFLLIIGLFCLIVANLPRSNRQNGIPVAVYIFGVLAVVSFVHTWYYMLGFMTWSFRNFEKSSSIQSDVFYERLTNWLRGTRLFQQAWGLVCTGPLNWWWSEQLCLFTVGAWTIFVSAQGKRYGIKHVWAYMLLGQVVAISVASNLFYIAICLSPALSPSRSARNNKLTLLAPLTLTLPVITSLLTIGFTPFTTTHTFLPNLLLMHALLIVPLSLDAPTEPHQFTVKFRTLYKITTILALALRLRTMVSVFTSIPRDAQSIKGLATIAWDTLHSHPAQSSIGWDVVWTTVSFFAWQVIGVRPHLRSREGANVQAKGRLGSLVSLVVGMTVFSVGVSAADEWREDEKELELVLEAEAEAPGNTVKQQ